MMKRILSGWFLASAFITGSASAADQSVATVPQWSWYTKNVAAYDWTGPYLGINGGGAWGRSAQSQVFLPALSSGDFDVRGGLVGGTAGFNLQVDRVVFGLEGDLDWMHISGSALCRLAAFRCTTQSDYLATGRARLGYAFPDHWLIYVTGGVAFGDINQSFSPAFAANSGTINNRVGWTAGAGIQFGLWTWQSSNWSIKFEYLYVNLGTFGCGIACSGIPGQVTDTTLRENIFRTGINYRF
jgi:outer membrane immunogenic protein